MFIGMELYSELIAWKVVAALFNKHQVAFVENFKKLSKAESHI